MPKLKPSLGEIYIKTPHNSFSAWFREELVNHQAWNPDVISSIGNVFLHKENGKELWRILVMPAGIRVRSKEPVVYLRKGIKIFMGSGKLEIT